MNTITQVYAYVDNSVLSLLRKFARKAFSIEKYNYIIMVMNQYGIIPNNILLTSYLFLEIIGLGKIRTKININNGQLYLEERAKLINSSVDDEAIERYIIFLQNLFTTEYKNILSRESIHFFMTSSLKFNPFIEEFCIFSDKVIQFAEAIKASQKEYDEFILDLVVDSVLRYGLNFNNNEVDEKAYLNILVFLQRRYYSKLDTILIIFMGNLKSRIELFMKKKGEKSLFRLNDDFADTEPYSFVFYGRTIMDQHYPITFLTFEKIEEIEKRFQYYFAATIQVNNNCPSLRKALCCGRGIIFNFYDGGLSYELISSEKYLIDLYSFSSSFHPYKLIMK